MAAKLTDHVWTARELLTTVIAPNTYEGDYYEISPYEIGTLG